MTFISLRLSADVPEPIVMNIKSVIESATEMLAEAVPTTQDVTDIVTDVKKMTNKADKMTTKAMVEKLATEAPVVPTEGVPNYKTQDTTLTSDARGPTMPTTELFREIELEDLKSRNTGSFTTEGRFSNWLHHRLL